MDKFIHDPKFGLELYVKAGLTNLWVVLKQRQAVAFFALSKSSLILNSIDLMDIKAKGTNPIEELYDTVDAFPSIKIDYFAVEHNHQSEGLGSALINLIREKAISDELSSTLFLTVDAFHTSDYSAVPFYKKNYFIESEYGIVKNQNKMREGISVDTRLLYLPLFREK